MNEIIKVQAYQVSCCGKIFKTERGAKIHMKLCCSNPANKACKTCKYIINGCKYRRGWLWEENEYDTSYKMHCENWELNNNKSLIKKLN